MRAGCPLLVLSGSYCLRVLGGYGAQSGPPRASRRYLGMSLINNQSCPSAGRHYPTGRAACLELVGVNGCIFVRVDHGPIDYGGHWLGVGDGQTMVQAALHCASSKGLPFSAAWPHQPFLPRQSLFAVQKQPASLRNGALSSPLAVPVTSRVDSASRSGSKRRAEFDAMNRCS